MKILFIRFSSLGDVILTTGVLMYIGEHVPGTEINILTFEEYAPVYEGLSFVNKVYVIPKGISLRNYINFLRAMPAFDYIVDWHDNIRSRIARVMIKGKTWVYDKQSLCRRLYVWFRLCKGRLAEHTISRYAAFLPKIMEGPMPELGILRPILVGADVPVQGKIVLHPFASKFTKIWPYFPELAKRLVERGCRVMVIGKGDFPEISGVERAHTPELKDMFRIMSDAAMVITTDSGPMHAACALGVQTLAIFGSTTRELGFCPICWDVIIVENSELRCRPCHVHGRPRCPRGHFKCMKDITLDNVFSHLEQQLPQAGASPLVAGHPSDLSPLDEHFE